MEKRKTHSAQAKFRRHPHNRWEEMLEEEKFRSESADLGAGAFFANVNYAEEPFITNSYSLSMANTMK